MTVIDAGRDREAVARDIWAELTKRLGIRERQPGKRVGAM